APRGRRGEEAMTASSTSRASTSSTMSTMTRREFGELVAGTLVAAAAQAADAQSRATSATTQSSGAILDVADWTYYWYGVEYATLARGSVVNGRQLYVEHWIPAQVRHPYAVVLVHGGYGQGTDWLSTPDGRRGWLSYFIEQGYKVYLVDRPGQGRNPFQP